MSAVTELPSSCGSVWVICRCTLRSPSTVVSIWSVSAGATVLQSCACVTFRGVLNVLTALSSLERVTSLVCPLKDAFHLLESAPRQLACSRFSNWGGEEEHASACQPSGSGWGPGSKRVLTSCVVVFSSRYSWTNVHFWYVSSSIELPQLLSGVHLQQVAEGLTCPS